MSATLAVDAGQPCVCQASRSRRVRITHLVSTLEIGGLEKVVFDLTRFANRDKFDVRVVCLGEAGTLKSDFKQLGIDVTSLRVLGRGTLSGVREVVRHLRSEPPDVLHTHNPGPHLQGALAARLVGVDVVVHTKHGRNYPGKWRKVWANRLATWFTQRVVAVSGDAADVALNIERIPAAKVQVLFNGIDLDRFEFADRSQERNVRRAIHVARICDPPKDHTTLLRAVRGVVHVEPDFHLDIVGDGPQRGQIEQLCRELGLENHVTFWGFRNDINQLLTRCGLFLLSTTVEGLSITILEAMANGLPVLTTRVGGNPEVVNDGQTGLLVPVGSVQAMTEAILQLVRDPAKAMEMGAAGRTRVEEQFDLRKVVSGYEALYCELLAQRSR